LLDQELHELGVAGACHRFEQRRAPVLNQRTAPLCEP
jgi:hypothetical protein